MARIDVSGFDEVERDLLKESEAAKEKAAKMLQAGARVVVQAQKDEIQAMTSGQGSLAKSIKETAVKSSDTGSYIEVRPTGSQPHGNPKKGQTGNVKNAQVGGMLEYGVAGKMSARPWMTTANEKSKDKVHEEMRKIWESGG